MIDPIELIPQVTERVVLELRLGNLWVAFELALYPRVETSGIARRQIARDPRLGAAGIDEIAEPPQALRKAGQPNRRRETRLGFRQANPRRR